MKTASGIIALILGLLSLLNIAGCSKAKREYNEFVACSNSTQGGIEGFMRGWSGASQGDPFGAVLSIADQKRTLTANAQDARWSAWACLIGTALASIICAAIPSKKPVAISAAPSVPPPVSEPAPAVPCELPHTVEDRLRTLLQLKESGLITDEEYQKRSQKIVELI